MYRLINILFVFSSILVVNSALSPFKQCKGQKFDDFTNRISSPNCDKKLCDLIKETNTTLTFRFNPVERVPSLTNQVYALIAGFPIPFIGLTGTSACGNIRRADTGELAPCPLEPGQEYVYKNNVFIRSIYPDTRLTVHWSLDTEHGSVICFEAPAVIRRRARKTRKN